MIHLPLSCRSLLSQMKGKRLERVTRTLLPCDYEALPAEERDELSDGSLDLFFEGGLHICLWSYTEPMSVGVVPDPLPVPDWVYRDVSENGFWKERVGQIVVGVTVLKAPVYDMKGTTEVCPSEFGLLFDLSEGGRFLVEYSMLYPYSDSLIITPGVDHIPPGTYSRISL
ncbi:MAG TPA: hypothetical protein VD973_16835 [Symbiobacteriaceae bacterium]|nr:hypothetical protein [Symbiobacteriaceae bacterium]